MKHTTRLIGFASLFLLVGPVYGQGGDNGGGGDNGQNGGAGGDQVQEQVNAPIRVETQEPIQAELGSLADELKQLRYRYRVQTQVLLKEREELIQQYRKASEEDKAQIREQLREQQQKIAENHRELRRQIRQEIRELRHQYQNRKGGEAG